MKRYIPNPFVPIVSILCVGLIAFGLATAQDAPGGKPVMTFHVSFDRLTVDPDHATGEAEPREDINLEFRIQEGVRGRAYLPEKGELAAYSVEGNLNPQAATVSMWVRPENWSADDNRYQKFFYLGSPDPRFRISMGVRGGSKAGKADNVRLYMSSGKRGTPDFKRFSVTETVDWRKGQWHKLDATWDGTEMRIYVDGRLGAKQALPNVDFPALENRQFYIARMWRGKHTKTHSVEDRTTVDEVKIWNGVRTAEAIAAAYAADRAAMQGALEKPLLRIPKTDAAPTIDGKLDEAAWRDAAAAPIRQKNDGYPDARENRALVTWGEEAIYIGFKSHPNDADPVAKHKEHDGKVFMDDCFELYLWPKGKADEDTYFQFIVNAAAATLESRAVVPEWDGEYDVKTHRGDDGWSVELAIPYKTLETAAPAPGDTWLAVFGRSHYREAPYRELTTSWADFMQRYVEAKGELVFDGKGRGAQLTLGPDLSSGRLALRCRNVGPSPVTCTVKCAAKGVDPLTRTVTVEPDDTGAIDASLSGFKNALLTVAIVEPKSGTMVQRWGSRLYVKDPIEVAYIPYVRKGRVDIEANFGNIDDARAKAIGQKGATLRVEARGPGGIRAEKNYAVTSLKDIYPLPIDWADGDYTFDFTLTVPGHDPITAQGTLTKPPTPFLGTDAGVTDKVIWPWTEMRYGGKPEGRWIEVWGRRYVLHGPFATGIGNQGRELLRGPVTLTMTTAAGTAPFEARREVNSSTRPNGYEAEYRGGFGQITGLEAVTVKHRLEYDGYNFFELTLDPEEIKEIRHLVLEIPLRADVAKYIRTPKRQPWNGKRWTSGFEPYVYVCNEDEGFNWFFDSEANWVYPEGAKPTEIVVDGDTATIRVHLVMKPVEFERPATYVFGYQATPVKPMMEGWRGFNTGKTRPVEGQNAHVYNKAHRVDFSFFTPSDDKIKAASLARQRRLGLREMHYVATQVTYVSDVVAFFRRRWTNPYNSRSGDHAPVCQNSGYTEYVAWHAREFLAQFDENSIYTDVDRLVPCDNRLHGCGTTDALGRAMPTYHIAARREFYKRLATVCRNAEGGLPPRGYLMCHAHDNLVLPYHSFADLFYPGEQYANDIFKNRYFYMDDLDPVAWRAELRGKAAGIPHILLNQFVRGSNDPGDIETPEYTESLHAMGLLNDIKTNRGHQSNDRAIVELWTLRERLGLDEDDLEFVAYWRKDAPVEATTPKAEASLYKTSKGTHVVVANFAPEKREIEVTIDRKALKLEDVALDPVEQRTGAKVPLVQDNTIRVPVKGRNYAIVTLAE